MLQKFLLGKSLYAVLRTLGCLIQEGVALISIYNKLQYSHLFIVISNLYCLDFSPPPRTLFRPPRLLILAKGVESPILFLCRKDSWLVSHLTSFKRNYITARRSVKKRILQRFGDGKQLRENSDNQGEAEEVEEHNQNMTKEDYPNLFENLFD